MEGVVMRMGGGCGGEDLMGGGCGGEDGWSVWW